LAVVAILPAGAVLLDAFPAALGTFAGFIINTLKFALIHHYHAFVKIKKELYTAPCVWVFYEVTSTRGRAVIALQHAINCMRFLSVPLRYHKHYDFVNTNFLKLLWLWFLKKY
jgi:hypothetical protein